MPEILRFHLFIKLVKYFGVNGFQPHGHLELRTDHPCELNAPLPCEQGMILNDNSFKGFYQRRNPWIVSRWNGSGVEKVGAVVKFDMPGSGELFQRPLDLRGDGVGRNRNVRCVFPEITHQTGEPALPVGEKNGDHIFNASRQGSFLFNQEMVGPERIDPVFGAPLFSDPMIIDLKILLFTHIFAGIPVGKSGPVQGSVH